MMPTSRLLSCMVGRTSQNSSMKVAQQNNFQSGLGSIMYRKPYFGLQHFFFIWQYFSSPLIFSFSTFLLSYNRLMFFSLKLFFLLWSGLRSDPRSDPRSGSWFGPRSGPRSVRGPSAVRSVVRSVIKYRFCRRRSIYAQFMPFLFRETENVRTGKQGMTTEVFRSVSEKKEQNADISHDKYVISGVNVLSLLNPALLHQVMWSFVMLI